MTNLSQNHNTTNINSSWVTRWYP